MKRACSMISLIDTSVLDATYSATLSCHTSASYRACCSTSASRKRLGSVICQPWPWRWSWTASAQPPGPGVPGCAGEREPADQPKAKAQGDVAFGSFGGLDDPRTPQGDVRLKGKLSQAIGRSGGGRTAKAHAPTGGSVRHFATPITGATSHHEGSGRGCCRPCRDRSRKAAKTPAGLSD